MPAFRLCRLNAASWRLFHNRQPSPTPSSTGRNSVRWAFPTLLRSATAWISLGDSLDIDVDELLDYLARDSKTSAILLYLEQLSDARRFVSAARSASRNKPILVIKSGRSPAAQRLLNTTAGMDPAWDAAIQRAGLLRVQDTHELFSAVETLSHMRPLRGDRLMIISNGAAPAALANRFW